MRASQALLVLIGCTLVAGQPINQDHLKQPAETLRDLKEIKSADVASVAARFVFDHFGNSPGENMAQKKRPYLYLTDRKKQALDVVANDLSATADLVKKSTKFSFSDKDFFEMSSNDAGVQWGRSVPATKDDKRHATSKVSQADSTEFKRGLMVAMGHGEKNTHGAKAFETFGISRDGDGQQWGRSVPATKDDKRHATSKVSQADSTEFKRGLMVAMGHGEKNTHGAKAFETFGISRDGDGQQWGRSVPATKDDKRHATSKVSQADSTEVKRDHKVGLSHGLRPGPIGTLFRGFGMSHNGDGKPW